jgi:hypothetical protein
MLEWAMKKLARAFPGSFATPEASEDRSLGWREMLDAHPWITPPVFQRGVPEVCWKHEGEFVPAPKVTLDYLHAAHKAVEREAQKALAAPAPVPAGPPGDTGAERAAFLERHIAIGRLRRVAEVWNLDVAFAPSEADVAGMIGEMRARRFCYGPLSRIAAGEDVSPAEFMAGAAGRRMGAAR